MFQLLHRDRDAQCKLCKRREIRQVQFFDWLGHPLLYNDSCLGLTVQKTVEVPQVQYSDRVVDVPAAVHRQGLDVSVILQRQVRADSRKCLIFSY